jgi:hypothetical protein
MGPRIAVHSADLLCLCAHDVALQDVTYTVAAKRACDDARSSPTILQGVSGHFQPGQMTAVVRACGAELWQARHATASVCA